MPEKPFEPSGFIVPKPQNVGVIAAFIALFSKKRPSYEETAENP
jgi:hypothetical protein